MGKINELVVENAELKRHIQFLKDTNKDLLQYRSQAIMRANKIEEQQKMIDGLMTQLEFYKGALEQSYE